MPRHTYSGMNLQQLRKELARLERENRQLAKELEEANHRKKYTPYHERPPLSPEEHNALLERVLAVFDRLDEEDGFIRTPYKNGMYIRRRGGSDMPNPKPRSSPCLDDPGSCA